MHFNFNTFDWGQTSLGPHDQWPASLQIAYDIMMSSGFGMCIAWGPEKTLIYNEAYAPFLGARHPQALGQPLNVVWQEIWPDISPLVDQVMTGESVRFNDMHLVMTRNNYDEDTYWTFSYSPLRHDGRVCGFLNVATETTPMVLAQRRAAQYAERIQLALSAGAIIGTWVWDLVEDRFSVDKAFAESFGLDPAMGRSGLSLNQVITTVHPDDREGLVRAIDEAIRRGGAYAHQYRVRRADGHYYWVEANGQVELAADGTGTRFPGVLIDVEGRRAVEAERDHAIARLRTLNTELEQKVIAQSLARGRTWHLSPDILGVINASGYIEASNPAWLATLGWPEEKVAQCTFFSLVHPDDEAATRRAWNETVETGQSSLAIENRLQHRDGGWRWLSWVAVRDDTKIYCSARDVTAERKRQAELVKRTAERDRLWERTNDLMGTAGLDGFIRAVNPAWTALLGWSEAELFDRPFMTLIDPEDHAVTNEALRRLAMGQEITGFMNRFIAKDGTRRSITWTANPADNMEAFFAVGRDVTDQLAAEASLRQAQKMEAVGQLTGGIAHDFNNLLAGITGALELMGVRMKQGRLQDLEKYRIAAHDAAARAALLTHRLLAFSRRQPLTPKVSDLNDVIDGMLELIQHSMTSAIAIECRPASNLWAAVVDVSQFENALLNLCINARDAMPDGGRIIIETGNQSVPADFAQDLEIAEGDYVVMTVSDTGSGMSPDIVAKVFEPFFTTKPIGKGTGLGLSMIYGFVKQSNGQVTISSTAGIGTQVRIYLPRHQ
ncbi:PAS domain-containing protein [Alcaligenaceae bacterium C4P045]|nr:PAS domain-containing protein [Alcaligenaceae bacterium C4P045]